MATELILTNRARQALVEARTVDEVKDIRDKAEAVRMYAKQAGWGLEMVNDAAEIKLRAERKAGEMLAVMDKNKGAAQTRLQRETASDPTLEEVGVTKTQSHRWQAAADVPQADFDRYVERTKADQQEISTAGVLRLLTQENGNGKQKPKTNRAGDAYEPQGFDACQTPAYAIDPLLPYVPMEWTVWEPASGEGTLLEAMYDAKRQVVGSDILVGKNFFDYEPEAWDALITNPPYSIKYQWLERCYQLGKPFALLLPVETLGARKAQVLFVEYGLEVIFLDKRINFKMPNKGWDGGGAQFPVAWFTWQFNLGAQMTFAELKHETD